MQKIGGHRLEKEMEEIDMHVPCAFLFVILSDEQPLRASDDPIIWYRSCRP